MNDPPLASTRKTSYGLPYPQPTTAGATARMRANRRVNTKPERLLRSRLHRLGYRFRKDFPVDAGQRRVRVDIAFPGERLAVFVDGCFWHRCPEHGTTPASNESYWVPKLQRNVERDNSTTSQLRDAGWTVVRIWEHVPVEEAAAAVLAALNEGHAAAAAVDLFAGAGGSTEGLKAAGYRVVGAVESDPSACRSYVSNHPKVRLFDTDIRDVDPGTLRSELGLARGELALLNACPPCQGFSSLGAAEPDDPRNDLVTTVFPFIDELRPQSFILENVPGLRGDDRLEGLLRLARASGYGVRSYVVNATDFGVPQTRRRLIAIGVLGLAGDELPAELAESLPSSFRRKPPAVGATMAKAGPLEGTADPVHRARTSTTPVIERIRLIPVGGDRFDLPKEQQLKCHQGLSRRNATASYGRIRLDQPAPTLTTRCTTPACGRFVHPTEDRGISLREAALLQTFPLRYRFHGTYQSLEAQIGNAVPVRMAKALGLAAATLLSRREADG